jgi:hypothetical protein
MSRIGPVRLTGHLGLAGLLSLSALVAASLPPGTAAQSISGATCSSTWADGTGLVWAVFCSTQDGPGDLYEREPDGDVRRITHMGAEVGSVDLSPDGSLVVFDATRPDKDARQIFAVRRGTPLGHTPIHLVSNVAQLTHEGDNRDPFFDPSGVGLVFFSDRDGALALWSMHVDGSAQRPLVLASGD